MAYPSTVVTGSKTNAQLGDTVATLGTLAAGRYAINVATYVSVAAAAGDMDNVQLVVGSTTVGALLMAPTINVQFTNPTIWVSFASATAVKVTAVANASGATVVYHAVLVATPEALF